MAATAQDLLDRFGILYLDISVLCMTMVNFWILVWLINGLIGIHLEWLTDEELMYHFIIRALI